MANSTGKYFHLAGLISLIGHSSDFGMEWHDALTPIAPNFTLIDKAVLECAVVGCETIWIICNDDMTPLLRYRLGDWVYDPVWQHRTATPQYYQERKEIPIFYIPTHPDDLDRRDCMGWGVLYGARTASAISRQISKWTEPHVFFVSFPYGLYDYESLRKQREVISSHQRIALKHKDETVWNNDYLSFTFKKEDLEGLIRDFKEKSVNLFKEGKKIPLSQRYSGRHFSLNGTFEKLKEEVYKLIEVDWYYSINGWESYRTYLQSNFGSALQKPLYQTLKYNEFNRIPIMKEE